MRALTLITVLAILGTGLAGCLSPSSVPPTLASEPPPPALARLNATPANASRAPTLDDWLVVNASVAPEGALTAFNVTVPAGSVHKDRFFNQYDAVDLLVSPLLPEGGNLSAWMMAAFAEKDGKLIEVLSVGSVSGTVEPLGLLGGQAQKIEARSSPAFGEVFMNGRQEGTLLHVVVALRGAQADAAFGLRFLAEAPKLSATPPATPDDFVRAQQGRAPIALPVVATGQGLHVAVYDEVSGLPLFPLAEAIRIGDPKVEGSVSPDARPAAAARDQTLSAASPYPHGWSDLFGLYFPGAVTAGTWDGGVSLGQEKAEGSAPIVWADQVPGGSTGQFLLGFPDVGGTGDATSASSVRLHVKAASEDAGSFEDFLVSELDLGATLRDLFGIPASTIAVADGGLLGPTLLAHAGSDLVVATPGGAQRVLAGVAPVPAG